MYHILFSEASKHILIYKNESFLLVFAYFILPHSPPPQKKTTMEINLTYFWNMYTVGPVERYVS